MWKRDVDGEKMQITFCWGPSNRNVPWGIHLSFAQLSSGIASLFLDIAPAIIFAVTTACIWLGLRMVDWNSFEILEKLPPTRRPASNDYKEQYFIYTASYGTTYGTSFSFQKYKDKK